MTLGRTELLDRLMLEIEVAWNTRSDDELVDLLAEKYPALAEDLYEFFATVVESTAAVDSRRPSLAAADQRTRDWLEREGFKRLAAAYQQYARESSTTPPKTVSDSPFTVARQTVEQGRRLLRWLRDTTGESTAAIAAALEVTPGFLADISKHSAVLPKEARIELARRVEKARGIPQADVLSLLDTPVQRMRVAASRTEPYLEPTSYESLIARSDLDRDQKQYWLSLA